MIYCGVLLVPSQYHTRFNNLLKQVRFHDWHKENHALLCRDIFDSLPPPQRQACLVIPKVAAHSLQSAYTECAFSNTTIRACREDSRVGRWFGQQTSDHLADFPSRKLRRSRRKKHLKLLSVE
jgi:hypothetical protein